MISRFSQLSRILLLVTLALLPRLAQAQRVGPLGPPARQQSTTQSAERAAAVRPPSLRLSLPSPAAIALLPLGPDDLQRLQPQEGRPPVIGVHRRLPPGAVTPSFSGGAVKTTAERAWQLTAGGRLWRLKMTSPGARAMRIHFRDFAIGAGRLWLHSASGQVVGPYSGSGLYGDGDFWSGIVFGESLTIEYLPDGESAEEAVPFRIVAISHIWDDAFGGGVEGGVRWPQGMLGSSDRQGSVKPLPGRIDVAVGTQSKKARLAKKVERSSSLQQPRPKAARQLVPGQPVSFRRGPVDSPTLFNGDNSFRLEVPDNASRVTFTLESDVDVALRVRYGEDNTIQDGRVVFDHGSRNPTGNERIGITRRSEPPLRAGTYFVSVSVFATGVVAEGTVTATVETNVEDCHLDVTCYPEWSNSAAGVAHIRFETNGVSSICSGTLLNNRQQDLIPYFLTAAHCVATEEEARSVIAYWFYQTQACNGDLPDFQSVPHTEGARLLSTLGAVDGPEGDMTLLRLEGDLPDGVMFQGWDANPQLIGAQVTGIHHPRSDDWGFFKRISFGQIIPDPIFGTSEDVHAIVSYTHGYTQGGSSGSALFSSPGTVVGAFSFGRRGIAAELENACRTGSALPGGYTHFSVFYPHIQQFIDGDSPLTPGQPATFRLEPVDTPTIFLGGSSFRLEVPENASRVTFTLESVDPDINVDLYVRYGEDNDIRDGRVISDYSSEGPTGNEEIIITRQSDPPLRAGTYFVSLGVRTTGVVAEGTVRAEFDTPLQTGDQIYYFPHLAVGASWQTTISYINYSREEVTCQTDFISDHGTPLMVSFAELGTVDSRTDVLPPGGSVHQETNVALSAPLAPGWARATCSGPVQASLLFRQHNSEGMPVAEAGVNAATVPATRFVTFAEQGEGKQGTGVAYANPSDTAALVTFTARDADGEVLAIEDLMLPPNGHGAQNMLPLFDLSSFTGSLEVTSTVPIVSLSLNFEAAPVFSSLPPGELDASAQGSTTYYFPHLAVGASWQTTITYINYSREEVTCQTDFISDHGTPLMVSFAELGTVDSRTDVLPPGGSVHQETNVALSAPLAPGWARATCSGPVQASLLFRQHSSEGMPVAEAGVNAATVPATRFVTFAEQGEGKQGTGVAYANPSDTAALVTFTARDADGEVLAIEDLMLPPNGHGAQNMLPLFDLSSFTGSLEVTSTVPIVSLSLNFEAAPVFSSLPPGETPAMEIPASGTPDLVVQTPSVSDSSPNAGGSFTLSATVRNQGNGLSASTTLRYYRSTDATISTGDTQVGTDTVSGLSASGATNESISLLAPSTAGTYYYGACIDPVSGESNTRNNCSRAVTVTVAPQPTREFHVWGDSGYTQYLGFFSCVFCTDLDTNSINNEFGPYGNRFSSTSIRNEFSQYGNRFSTNSACNQSASNPPRVFNQSKTVYYGELTLNEFRSDAMSELVDWLERDVCP